MQCISSSSISKALPIEDELQQIEEYLAFNKVDGNVKRYVFRRAASNNMLGRSFTDLCRVFRCSFEIKNTSLVDEITACY